MRSVQMPSAVASRPSRNRLTARSNSFCAAGGKRWLIDGEGRPGTERAKGRGQFYRRSQACPARSRGKSIILPEPQPNKERAAHPLVPDAIDLSAVRRALVVKLRHHG